MVTSSHEAMHRVFQEDPNVFARTFRRFGLDFEEFTAADVVSPDLTEIRPVERRTDTLLRFTTTTGKELLLLVEAQRRKDTKKPRSWAYYLAYTQAKYEAAEATLLIVCQDQRTADWAKGPFHLGPATWPALRIQPLVIGPQNMPVITDAARAAADVPLAVLSAITHARDPEPDAILKELSSALAKLDEDTRSVFAELTELGLGAGRAKKIWEDLMAVDLSFFRSSTSQRLRAEGEVRGVAKGRAEEAKAHILKVLDRRGIVLTETHRERVFASDNLEQLEAWFDRSLTATTGADLFTEALDTAPVGAGRGAGAAAADAEADPATDDLPAPGPRATEHLA